MDLDPLEPNDPSGQTPHAVPPVSWAWNDSAPGAGEEWAPRPSGAADQTPWAGETPANGAGVSPPPRFSRRTKVLAGVTALVTCAAAAWATGAASGSHTPTVRIEPGVAASASSGSNGSNGSNGSTGSGSSPGSTGAGNPGRWGGHRGVRFGMFAGQGAGGTIATIDSSAQTFTVTRPARPPSSSSTSGTPAVTPSPTPLTVTTGTSTTYEEFQSSTFAASDAPIGTRITAVGTRNADGSLTATTISLMPTGMGPGWHAKAPSSTGSGTPSSTGSGTPMPKTIPPNAAAHLAKAPFALGQVSAISGSPSTITLTTPWGTDKIDTTLTTTFTSLVSTGIGFGTLAVGQRVIIRGQRQSDGDVAASAIVIIPAGVTPSSLGFGGPGFIGRGLVNGPAAADGPRGPWTGFGQFGWGRRPPAGSPPAGSSAAAPNSVT